MSKSWFWSLFLLHIAGMTALLCGKKRELYLISALSGIVILTYLYTL